MAVDYKQIYRDIHGFVVLATGLPDKSVRPAYPNASAKPTQDRDLLCSINIINQTTIGIDARKYANQTAGTDLDESVVGDRNITASIKTYGEGADDTAETIMLFLKSSAGINFLNTKELGYLRHGSIINLSSLQNGSFENRRQLDVEFHIKTSVTAEVNAIESAEIGFAYYGSDEITGTIEVN